ncbi:TonB-dependent receptor [Marinoscillum pacificum]|uniref:TonB-dependent receptor n=1 Tax=Marinoscillum pacificum TaxID=392723 RepID=UPI002157F0F7|nr:TonB-dependent receptor [Marinoscillum pacificum]
MKLNRLLAIMGLVCLLHSNPIYAQDQFTVSGYLRDSSNGEALIGATIRITGESIGTVTNVYGFYSITLSKGNYVLDYRYVGYDAFTQSVELNSNTRLDIELKPSEQQLEAVVISGKAADDNISNIEMSTAELDIKSIQKMPAFAGEVDVIKSIQLLPGVTTVGEGAAGFNVRGGSVGQNLVLLDEAPVYQSSHLMGFFSVFNPDAVKDVKLYKGGVPAQYGGRVSSILDIRMKEGNSKSYDVSGGIGTVFSRLAIEGPIKKDKASFIVAARRSYADVIAKVFTDALSDGTAMYFYDLTAKTNYHINENNRIYLSGYWGRDVLEFDENQGFDWGNRTASFRWNHLYSDKLFSNLTMFYSNYDYGFKFGDKDDLFQIGSEVSTVNMKPEFNWFLNTNNELTFGGEAIMYLFEPGTMINKSVGETTNSSLESRRALEAAIYASNNQKVTEQLSLQYGLRLSYFNYLGGTVFEYGDTIPGNTKPIVDEYQYKKWGSIADFYNLEPRLSFNYKMSTTASLKGSFTRMNQYIHLISNTTASTPIDVWQPSTNNIDPQAADQVALGYFKNLSSNEFELSAEAYYKWMHDQVDYIDGADVFVNQYLESQLLSGKGRAYGLELYGKKNQGRLTGWMSYTLGWTELKVDGINYGGDKVNRIGDWYPTRYDQRHNVKLAAFYELNDKVSFSANFSYISGTPTTFPTDRLNVAGYVVPYINNNERNNYRIPDYHRLDLGMSINNVWRGKKGRSGEDNIAISVYNAYGRQNPFSIYFSQERGRIPVGSPVETNATQLSIIGSVIPAIAYNFKF